MSAPRPAAPGPPEGSPPAPSAGPLAGLRVVEFDGIGPAPFLGRLLASHGARVVRLARPGGQPNGIDAGPHDLVLAGRPCLPLDLKDEGDLALARALLAGADALVEGHRPGVLERLGLSPAALWADNPALVIGRVTGYGQDGPLSRHPGHDINYVALSGALHAVGAPDRPPPPPLNLVGDYGGGAMLLAFGLLAARLDALATGRGRVVDAAMLDGAALLMAPVMAWRNAGLWSDARGANPLDGGAPYYRCYATRDGRFLAVGAIEPRFYAAFRAALGLDDPLFDAQDDRARWPAQAAAIARLVASRDLAGWAGAVAVPDACLSPVLALGEAPAHPQVAARGSVVEREGRLAPGPAPRFSGGAGAGPAALADALEGWPLAPAPRAALLERAASLAREASLARDAGGGAPPGPGAP